MRARPVVAAAVVLLTGCVNGSAPRLACGPERPAEASALGYASLSRMRDEGFVETFALVRRSRGDDVRWSLDDGRACVRFSGPAPDVRLTWRTEDPELARHLSDEARIEGLRR